MTAIRQVPSFNRKEIIMTDIKMENNRLVMRDGDFVLVDGVDEIKQHIIIALNTFYNDWLLDYTKGIDYAHGMRNTEFLEHDVKKQLQGIKDVQSVDDFSLTFDRKNLTINITAKIKTKYGNINLNEIVQQ